MKKYIFLLVGFLLLVGVHTVQAQQQSALRPSQGGTGITSATGGDVGLCIKVLDDSPFTYELGSCGGGGGGDSVFSRTLAGLIYAPTTTDSFAIGAAATSTAEFWVDPNIGTQYIKTLLGVGSTSPTASLSITNTGTTDTVRIEDQTSPDATAFIISNDGRVAIGSSTIASQKLLLSGNTYDLSSIRWENTANASTSPFLFGIRNQGSGLTRFSIEDPDGRVYLTLSNATGYSGNVGIGTTTPGSRLSVAGGAYVGGDLTATGTARIGTLTGLLLGTSGTVSAITTGSEGNVLSVSGGVPAWVATSTLGFGSGSGSTSTSPTIIVVAANDASTDSKAQANYIADGTDDEDTLTTALSALPANGGTIYLTEGTFNVGTTTHIPDRTRIIGQGRGITVIKSQAGASGKIFANLNQPGGHIHLAHMTVDGNYPTNASQAVMVMFERMSSSTIEHMEFMRSPGTGLIIEGDGDPTTQNVIVRDVVSHMNGNGGIDARHALRKSFFVNILVRDNSTGFRSDHSESYYSNVTADKNTGDGFQINNVFGNVYNNITATRNGLHGIEVVGLTHSAGSNWVASNNGSTTVNTYSDIFFDDNGSQSYGTTSYSVISGIRAGAATFYGTTNPEKYAIEFEDTTYRNLFLTGITYGGIGKTGYLKTPTDMTGLVIQDVSPLYGIYNVHGAFAVGYAENSSTSPSAFKVNTNGQVSISSSSPSALLSLHALTGNHYTKLFEIGSSSPSGTTTAFVFLNDAPPNDFRFGVGTTVPWASISAVNNRSTHALSLVTNGSHFLVNNNGRLIIGSTTASISQKVLLSGTTYDLSSMRFENLANANTVPFQFGIRNPGANLSYFSLEDGSGRVYLTATARSGYEGNVGVGTTTPIAKLGVAGDIWGGNITASGTVRIGGIVGGGLTDCDSSTSKLLWDTSTNQFSCGTDQTGGGGGGSFPFSSDTTYGQTVYSTSTPTLWFKSGMFASSTSFLDTIGLSTSSVGTVGSTSNDVRLTVHGNMFLSGSRSRLYFRGDDQNTDVMGLQLSGHTSSGNNRVVITPVDTTGAYTTSTIRFGGGGLFNSVPVNLYNTGNIYTEQSTANSNIAITGYTKMDVATTSGGNFVGMWAFTRASQNAGGTSMSAANVSGNAYGSNPQVILNSGATFYSSAVAEEVNVAVLPGASTYVKAGSNITHTGGDTEFGAQVDAALLIGSPSIGWMSGIEFTNFNGDGMPIAASGTILRAQLIGTTTTDVPIKRGIDLSEFTCSEYCFNSDRFYVTGEGRVGVGSSTPTTHFSIHAEVGNKLTKMFEIGSSSPSGTTTALTLLNHTTSDDFKFGISTSSPFATIAGVSSRNNHVLALTANGNHFLVNNNGRLIMGSTTTSISQKVLLSGTTYDLSSMRFENTANAGTVPFQLGVRSPGTSLTYFSIEDGSGRVYLTATARSGYEGNVGVGTTTPIAKFGVAGDVWLGNLIASGTLAMNGTGTSTFAGGVQVSGDMRLKTSLTGILKATAGHITAALVDLASDVTGVLPIANGGTATSSPVLLYKPSAIQVTSGASAITTGDGKAYFRIPAEYNGMNLRDVELALTASSSSDFVEVQISRGRQTSASTPHTWVDMLSTRVTIDTNELDSRHSATTTAINTSNDDVMEGDLIRIDVDRVPGSLSAVLIVQPVFGLP